TCHSSNDSLLQFFSFLWAVFALIRFLFAVLLKICLLLQFGFHFFRRQAFLQNTSQPFCGLVPGPVRRFAFVCRVVVWRPCHSLLIAPPASLRVVPFPDNGN